MFWKVPVWMAVSLWICLGLQAQDTPSAQTAMQQVVRKSGRAAVKVFAFDTARQVQTAGPFSAVVVSADGYMLTVAHAVRPGHTYKVTFPGGQTALAVGLGRIDLDPRETLPDIAMMKIPGEGAWPFAEMGSSAALRKGDPCMMLAYPESSGLPFPTVRYGTVSQPLDSHRFVVTDCTMEVGDSGGPLFDMDGRVIGLNSRCQAGEAFNHHVPVDEYRKYWSSLVRPINYTQYPKEDSGWRAAVAPARQVLPPVPGWDGGIRAVSLRSRMGGKDVYIAGTVWKADASGVWVISKNSAVGDTVFVTHPQGKEVRLKVAARNLGNDLVLLMAEKPLWRGLSGVETADVQTGEPELCGFLYAALPAGGQRRGVSGTGTFDMPPRFSAGYFGAMLVEQGDAVMIAFTDPAGPAARKGFRHNDRLLGINDARSASGPDFLNALMQFPPHHTIRISAQRGDSLFTQAVTLAERLEGPANHPAEMYEGGKSRRRDGFAKVWFTDMHVRSYECGSPVFDAQGRFCGIAIARFSRTATVVLHASQIIDWLAAWQSSAKND